MTTVLTSVLYPRSLPIGEMAQLADVELLRYDEPGHWPDGAAQAEVLVAGWGPASTLHPYLEPLRALRLIQVVGAGVEQWEGHVPEGVMLSNARGAHGGATAEWALAALLAVVRELPNFLRDQGLHEWRGGATGTLVDARVLVLGAGDLASELRRRLLACDAHVTLVGRTARSGVESVNDLPELLGRHDAVVVTVPQSSANEGLVDAAFLARMPDGAILVNAARGAVVRTDALLAELTAGRLRAALDVTDPEPMPPEHPLWSAPGLLLTPHVAGSTHGATERGVRVAAEQVRQFVAGALPDNLQSS